jgi:CHAT domain-containing protein
VWWCPVGIMNQFPLHAAGHHEDLAGAPDPSPRIGPPRTVMDRVVSSYTTTLRGLVHARAHRATESEARTVVIAVPDAPGLPMLQGVAREADHLVQKVPHAHLLRNPTWQTVIEALPHYAIAHFACHGFADWTDPGSSRLVLGDYATSPLTVTDINALNLNADLAFLSACETSGADLRLADEAVHLTGAFHLAGYRYVVGTLWPVFDVAAERIAKAFYAHLTDSGSTAPDASRSPVALHHAVHAARADFPDQPTFWAAHIQAGA